MRRKYDYDPGAPYEPPPYRRRRQRYGEHDDAWAAADEDDFYDDGVEIEDLAAGYVDHEMDVRRLDDDTGWTPPPYRPGTRGRSPRWQSSAQRPRYDRARRYADDSSYHRDRAKRGEYGVFHEKPKRGQSFDFSPARERVAGIPFWQILTLVVLGMFALLATMLACVSVLLL